MSDRAPRQYNPAPAGKPSRSDGAIANALTVDVEEHFQVSAFESVVPREDWARHPSRVEANTNRLLDLFDACEVKGTFFTLGMVAERTPSVVKEIARRGHEVASHGWSHRLVYGQSREAFEAETRRSKALLEDLSGQEVSGYRAASFSIRGQNLWALDVLAQAGFRYDSSVFPVVHDRYGMPGAPRQPYRLRTPEGGSLVEIPPTTVKVGRLVLPAAGGGYLRLYPLAVTRWAVRRVNDREGAAAIVYLHPWEVDPGQPRVAAPFVSRLRHYVGLRSTASKLRRLFETFPFVPMRELVAAARDLPEVALA